MFKSSEDCSFNPNTNNNLVNINESTSTEKSISQPLQNLTKNIISTYNNMKPEIPIVDTKPRRILTNPCITSQIHNNGLDNIEGNLIVKVSDVIKSNRETYKVIDLLGVGTFGQVFRCQKSTNNEIIALKIIKNLPAYTNQGLIEIKIANLLNYTYDPDNKRHIVRLLDSFEFQGHLCLVFELLHSSLLDILQHNQYRGLPLYSIQKTAKQLLIALVALQEANVIHCKLLKIHSN